MNIIQAFEGPFPDRLKPCVDSIALPGYEKIFLDKFPADLDRLKGLRDVSDRFRFTWLIAHPDDIWIDCDVLQVTPFDFPDNGKPWISHVWGSVDSWIIAPRGYGDTIQKIYEMALTQNVRDCIAIDFCRIANQNRNLFNLIPANYFEHKEDHLFKPEVDNVGRAEPIE
jgi:hypothetical protein